MIEIILSIALITIVSLAPILVSQWFQSQNNLDLSAILVVQALRHAQVLAQASYFDTSWGIKIQTGSVVIFRGSSYSGRIVDYDETISFPAPIESTGISEIVFSKFSGAPDEVGQIILGIPNTNTITHLTLREKGIVDY